MKLAAKYQPAPPRIEMLPLIDVVFLLLVFFIYAFVSMSVHHGQAVDLPQASSVEVVADKEGLAVTIQPDQDGAIRVFVGDELLPLAELAPRLKEMAAATGGDGGEEEVEVQIFADGAISYQHLFAVLDQVKSAGLSHISLQAEPARQGP
ncbi:MAG: biopolymer transporter ExbD [Thermodesulfobacteriota bacterium]